MTYYVIGYFVGFIITLVAVSWDMLQRGKFNILRAWCIALIWPLSVPAVIFTYLFDYLKLIELQGKVQDWYDNHAGRDGCVLHNRRKEDVDRNEDSTR